MIRLRNGFTLIELLVVIAIIAVLAAILFPVFSKARDKAYTTTCLNNQRQLVVAVTMYTQDFNEKLPLSQNWIAALTTQYVPDRGVWKCPAIVGKVKDTPQSSHYVYNNGLSGLALGDVAELQGEPPSVCVTTDGIHEPTRNPVTYSQVYYSARDAQARHNGLYVVSYLDGHVQAQRTPPGSAPSGDSVTIWAKPSDAEATDGKVANWKVQYGTGFLNFRQATATKQPTYEPTGFNGNPAITFASGQWLDLDVGTFPAPVANAFLNGPWTMFITVYATVAAPSYKSLMDSEVFCIQEYAAPWYSCKRNHDLLPSNQRCTNWGKHLMSGTCLPSNATGPFVLTFLQKADNKYYGYVNGKITGTSGLPVQRVGDPAIDGTVFTAADIQHWSIAAAGSYSYNGTNMIYDGFWGNAPGYFPGGKLGEFLFYTRALDETERVNVETYLMNKYGAAY